MGAYHNGVITAMEGDLEHTSDGGQPNGRLCLPATAYNRWERPGPQSPCRAHAAAPCAATVFLERHGNHPVTSNVSTKEYGRHHGLIVCQAGKTAFWVSVARACGA
ncbi:hypothetical protein GCM10029964_086710 [Kibdelosporangium lantanae]